MPRRIARPTTIAWKLSLACCLALAFGCFPNTPNGSAPRQAPAVLSVENDGFDDLVVYVATETDRQRLGTAPAVSTTNFVIPQQFVIGSPTVRFLGDDIGGRRPEVSQQTSVAPGDTVMMVIQGAEDPS